MNSRILHTGHSTDGGQVGSWLFLLLFPRLQECFRWGTSFEDLEVYLVPSARKKHRVPGLLCLLSLHCGKRDIHQWQAGMAIVPRELGFPVPKKRDVFSQGFSLLTRSIKFLSLSQTVLSAFANYWYIF